VVGATAVLAYVAYIQVTRVNPQYHNFPPPVAKALRTAVYYTELDLNPSKALNSYKEALRIAAEQGMHPYSDEVFGIKLQIAVMLEKAGLVKPAIEVLEHTKREALAWIDEGRGRRESPGRELPGQLKASTINDSGYDVLEAERKQRALREYEERQRDKTLKKVIGIDIKLAELYSSDYIQDEKKAEASQIAAVELCLKEMRRRQLLGLPVGGGSSDDSIWLDLTEISSAFAELADTYTRQEKPELSLPLYMQALAMVKEDEGDAATCKQVVLLNNIAQAMVEQAKKPARPSGAGSSAGPSLPSDQVIENARLWAQKALDVAASMQPSLKDESCDASCVVASVNLGYIAEIQNKFDEAEKRFLEAKRLAHKIDYKAGVERADIALGRLIKKQRN
jgi:tetratricopeptide (TPR) repeat protein